MSARTVLAERQSLATKFGTDAPNLTAFSADPGTTGSVTGELTGGSPAFARKAANWGAADATAKITGTATFDIASGSTVAYVGAVASLTLTTADLKDSGAVTSQAFASQGTYAATATFQET